MLVACDPAGASHGNVRSTGARTELVGHGRIDALARSRRIASDKVAMS
jgi:hypothetical protein